MCNVSVCLKLVLDFLDRIENLVEYFSRKLKVEVKEVWLWKGRAHGQCREDSDIDIWMEIAESDKDRVERLNKRLLENPLPWEYYNGKRVIWDFKFGVGSPMGAKISLDALRKVKAKRSSV